MRGECAQNNARISVVFYPTATKFGVNIVKWSVLDANVLDFRYIFALSNYGANCLRLGMKNDVNFGFLGPVRFRGNVEEISREKVLLKTKPCRVGKFWGCRFFDVWRVAREKRKEKKLSAKYNGSLALATLERATIIRVTGLSMTAEMTCTVHTQQTGINPSRVVVSSNYYNFLPTRYKQDK